MNPTLLRIGATLCVLLLTFQAQAQTGRRYKNVINTRFATVSDGPQNTLLVDVPKKATPPEIQAAVRAQMAAAWKSQQTALRGQMKNYVKSGLLKGKAVMPVSMIIQVRQDGKLVLPTAKKTRDAGVNTLTFRYTGFSANDEAFLRAVVESSYPTMVEVYGAPAWSGEVEVVNGGDFDSGISTEVRRLAFGAYSPGTAQIFQPLYISPENVAQSFILNILHAFHGPTYFAYDAWEQGFARAAASIVNRRALALGVIRPDANNLYSLLKYYDLLNQPALGNNTFFPPSQANIPVDRTATIAKMIGPRIAMSGAAWLKVYIENPDFFRQFNAQYYAQFGSGLAGNVPQLKAIAAGLVPQVEGLAFNDWYARQFILDTSVTPGTKLYAYSIPSGDYREADGQSALTSLVYYRTEPTGDETLLNDRAYITYYDSQNVRLSGLGSGSDTVLIGESEPGEGSVTTTAFPTSGFDNQRITADVTVGKETARVYIPSGFTGDLQVVVLGVQDGTFAVQQVAVGTGATRNANGNIERGAFGTNLGTNGGDLSKTTIGITVGQRTTNYVRNLGEAFNKPEYDYVYQQYVIIRSEGQGDVKTVTRNFTASTLPQFVTFPVEPLSPAAETALGLSPLDFLLSFWDTARSTYETYAAGQQNIAKIKWGRGYWLKIAPASGAGSATVNMTGYAPPEDTDVTVAAPNGWVMFGVPFQTTVPLNQILVKFLQRDAIPWDQAVEQNLVAASPFTFDTVTGTYVPVTDLRGDEWRGYFIRVIAPSGVALLVPGPQSPTSRAAKSRAASQSVGTPLWNVTLRAMQEGGQPGDMATATLGVRGGASRAFDNRFDKELPPAVAPVVRIAFPHRDWGGTSGEYMTDYRSENKSGAETWDFTVTPTRSGRNFLSWNGVAGTSRQACLMLVDKISGARIPMHTRSSYVWTADGTTPRNFQIVAESGRQRLLSISGFHTVPNRGSGMAFGFDVSDNSTVSLEVATGSGRVVARPGGSRSVSGGRQSVPWNGRAESGSPLAIGQYRVIVRARAEDGTVATFEQPLMLVR